MSEEFTSNFTFVELLLAIIVSWVLVAQWQRVLDNAAYSACGLSEKSTFHSLVVAAVVTAILLAFIFIFRPPGMLSNSPLSIL